MYIKCNGIVDLPEVWQETVADVSAPFPAALTCTDTEGALQPV
ncbi:hypothetical protein ACLB1M_30160 [Escherichia coli]